MKLGIISDPSEKGFAYVRHFGLDTTEFCINVGSDAKAQLARAAEIQALSEQYGVKVASIGRWGTKRLNGDGSVNAEEQAQDFALLELAGALGCANFVCGCNEVEGMPFEENARLAAAYFRSLLAAAPDGVDVSVYNCDWGNIIYDQRGWDIVLPLAPGLGIKYDTSHCINRDGDYLWEMMQYGHHINHFHVKGTLRIRGENIPDPPAGLDDIQWGAVMALLYTHGYDGALSIEPHSSVWDGTGPRGEFGVRFTIEMMRKYIMTEG